MLNRKGQGALEYLLLIGGAILVAVVVITILSGISGPGGQQTEENAAQGICASRPAPDCGANAPVTVGGTQCACDDADLDNVCETSGCGPAP